MSINQINDTAHLQSAGAASRERADIRPAPYRHAAREAVVLGVLGAPPPVHVQRRTRALASAACGATATQRRSDSGTVIWSRRLTYIVDETTTESRVTCECCLI